MGGFLGLGEEGGKDGGKKEGKLSKVKGGTVFFRPTLTFAAFAFFYFHHTCAFLFLYGSFTTACLLSCIILQPYIN